MQNLHFTTVKEHESNPAPHLQLSEDAALAAGLQILQSLRPEVLLLVWFCPVMPHSEPGREVRGHAQSQVTGHTHTERRTATDTSCWCVCFDRTGRVQLEHTPGVCVGVGDRGQRSKDLHLLPKLQVHKGSKSKDLVLL